MAANRTRPISEVNMAANAQWEANRCGKHYGYRLKGNAGSKRPIPTNSAKSPAARFYQMESGHAPVGMYLNQFGHRDDDKFWWCGSGGRMVAQTWGHLFLHRSRWKDQQETLWKEVGEAMGWRVVRCRHVQISELLSMEKCHRAVMDFLIATDIGKFPPKWAKEEEEFEPAGSL